MDFVELHCHSNYSFLDGGSHPEELVQRVVELEMPALAITDTGGVYGAVKFMRAAKQAGVKPIVGATIEVDGEPLVLLAKSARGYSSLCRLASAAHRNQPKGEARLDLETLATLQKDLFAFVHLPADEEAAARRLRSVQEAVGRSDVFVELRNHLRPEDAWLSARSVEVALRCGAEIVASNDVHYHLPERRALHDVLCAIRRRETLDQARGSLHPNAERCLKGAAEMRRLHAAYPRALHTTCEIAAECKLSELDFKNVRFPGFPVPPGETPFSYLYQLCQAGARERYHPITAAVARRLQRELDVIEKTGLAEFFLINWDLMRFAKENGVPGQGRGSAADSIVAYVLGVTRVDPIAHNLLFERFLHEEMTTTPDIDIDFSTAHREKVIQYIYEKYGWERTGMVCNVVTFKPRMAIRQVGKALGFPLDLLDRMARAVDHYWFSDDIPDHVVGDLPEGAKASQPWRHFLSLCREVMGFPRHLSIHVGGMLVTGEPLVDIVPVEPATMPGRVVVQFDKDDVEDLGLIKMDMLGLRTLSVVAECVQLAEQATGKPLDLDRLSLDDPRVYKICGEADTVGVFQIESRAQMQTLPRTRPRDFNDLVVEVAIIRPGPIQGNAVHPYIRRRQGREPVTYAHPLLEPILRDTLGVILYQEQIIEIAMHVAAMRPSDADRFRRAMTRHFSHIEMASLEGDFVAGCLQNGVPREVAQELFRAVEGFASFGFCRSHAAAFARTAYETAWLKLNFPAPYYCALLNNQPMGFYHPSVLVGDAKRHGVTPLPVHINLSAERCLPESENVFRVGFNYLRDLGAEGALAIVEERRSRDYRSFDDFLDRLRGAPLNPRAVRNLVMVGAFDEVDAPRRELLWRWQERWHGGGLRRRMPAQRDLALAAAAPRLPDVDLREATRLEYRISDLSTGPHVIEFHRARLRELHAVDSRAAAATESGRRLRVGGLVITRQAPSTAQGVRFFTLEDEHGHINVTIKQDVYDRCRRVANRNPVLVIDGVMQRQDGVWSILATDIQALPDAEREFSRSHDYK